MKECLICNGDLEDIRTSKKIIKDNNIENILILKGIPAKYCSNCNVKYLKKETSDKVKELNTLSNKKEKYFSDIVDWSEIDGG